MRKTTTGPAKRYAKALFEIASEAGVSYVSQLDAMAKAVEENSDLEGALSSPRVSNANKVSVLTELASQVDADEALTNFVKLLGEKGRADILVDVVAWMEEFDRQASGVVVAKVQSATALNDAQRQELTSFVKGQAEGAKDVVLEEEVDAALIAGVRVYVGAKEFDTTVRGRFDGLRRALS